VAAPTTMLTTNPVTSSSSSGAQAADHLDSEAFLTSTISGCLGGASSPAPMLSKRFVNASRPTDLGKRVIVPSCCGISIISSRASRSYRLSLSLSPITALLGLKGLLELLHAG
jgi:hypothetical protein